MMIPTTEEVLITKAELEAMTEIQRDLYNEIDILKLEKEQLVNHCSNLEAELRIANSE